MLGFPTTDRNLREMTRDELGETPLCHEVARKAGIRGAVATDVMSLAGTIWGTFSRRNHPTLGFLEQHSHQELAFFPNDGRGMDRYADWTGVSQTQLLVTVTKAGRPGSTMTIVGDGVSFDGGLSVPLDSVGLKTSSWKDVNISGGPQALTQWVVGNPNPAEGGIPGGDPAGGIEFMRPAPGNLTVEGGSYFADWCAQPPHLGYTQAEASNLIGSILSDPAGWEAAGITFREVSEADARVRIRILEEASCNVPEAACTHYYATSPPTAYIELELNAMSTSPGGPANIVYHEAGHAFFYATHSGGGIMDVSDALHPEGPIASDIESVETWLGTPGDSSAGTFAVGLCQLKAR